MAYVGESLTVWKRSANFASARYLRPTIRFLWHTPYTCQLATYPPSLAHSASPRSEPSIRSRLFVLSSILPSIPLFLSPFSLFLLLPFFFFLDPLLPLLFNGCTRVSDRTPWVHTPAYAWRTACCKTASCARVWRTWTYASYALNLRGKPLCGRMSKFVVQLYDTRCVSSSRFSSWNRMRGEMSFEFFAM